MASLSASTWMLQTLFLASFLLLFSPTNAAGSNHLIKKACKVSDFGDFNETECVKILTSIPKISSALNFSSLKIAIIEEAINNATDILTLIRKKIKSIGIDSRQKIDLENCVDFYVETVKSFKVAIALIKHPDPKQDSYLHLLGVALMYIQICISLIKDGTVHDSTITTTNKLLQLFIEAALTA